MYMYTEGVMAVVQYCCFAITMEGSLAGENMSFRIIPMQILVYDVSYAAWTSSFTVWWELFTNLNL